MIKELDESDYERVWRQFHNQYNFNPSVNPREWPGIKEPTPSLTISLTESKNGSWPEKEEVIQFFKTCLLYTSPSPRDRG